MAGVALAPQDLTAATLPDFGVPGQPYGLLGSDVLSRFGAVRIDFTAQTLTLGGPQGPAATDQHARGARADRPPAARRADRARRRGRRCPPPWSSPRATWPSTSACGSAGARPPVHRRHRLVAVGRGRRRGPVRPSGLHRPGPAPRPPSAPPSPRRWCAAVRGRSPAWRCYPQLLGTANFGTIGANGLSGLLGSDQLQRFGWVISTTAGAAGPGLSQLDGAASWAWRKQLTRWSLTSPAACRWE